MILEGNADDGVAKPFVTTCCEGVHCAFQRFRLRLEIKKGSEVPSGVTGVGAESLLCLAKG